jgi:hypothetical protein
MTITAIQPIGAGLHDGISSAQYHADPCVAPSLSSSIAAEVVTRSPIHARLKHPRFNPSRGVSGETESMAFGSVVHELALGRGGGFSVWDGETWRGNAAQDFKENALLSGQTPIKAADFNRANAVVAAVHRQLIDMGLGYVLEEGKSEQVAIWKRGNHWMRAMFDRWIPERREIWDIKTTGKSAHPEQISRIVPTMNYDLRSEFYLMGAEAVTGIPAKHGGLGYQFLFVETVEPYCVTPCFLDQPLRERGRRRATEAMDKWAECMESGIWPGYVNGAAEITAPGWVDYEIEDSEITIGGEKMR